MKRTIGPVQAGICIAVALALALGIGYYLTNRHRSESYQPMPAAQSRADMVRNMRINGSRMLKPQPRSRTGL